MHESCKWIGDGEGCNLPAHLDRSYCPKHYERVYMSLFSEMADYIINKELKDNEHIKPS